MTTRQSYAAHMTNPTCASCHSLMDGIGVGFEEFDAVGRFRTTDHGMPVDATGTFSNSDLVNARFDGAVQLSALLAESRDVRDCVARQWFHFALARDDVDQDSCSLAAIQSSFRQSTNMRDLVVAIAGSTAFRYARW
jgi:hypothetical protein